MDALLELLSHEAWNGVAALVAILVIVSPFLVNFIKLLSSNQNKMRVIKRIASVALVISFFLPLFHGGAGESIFSNKNGDILAYQLFISPIYVLSFDVEFFYLILFSILIFLAFFWPITFILFYDFVYKGGMWN